MTRMKSGIVPEVYWERQGGGCTTADTTGFPCDDVFVSPSGKQMVTVESSYKAHFDMPRVATLDQLRSRPGVRVGKPKPNKYYR